MYGCTLLENITAAAETSENLTPCFVWHDIASILGLDPLLVCEISLTETLRIHRWTMPTLPFPIPTLQPPIPTLQPPIPTLQSPIPTLQSPIPTLQPPIPTLQLHISYVSSHLYQLPVAYNKLSPATYTNPPVAYNKLCFQPPIPTLQPPIPTLQLPIISYVSSHLYQPSTCL